MDKNSYGKQFREKNLDWLTGILEKNAAETQITEKVIQRRNGTLFLCDVNDLRRINDQYGHQFGDECLKQAAQILSYMICPEDVLGRRGGDEFVIYIANCRDVRQAQEMCERIEKRFRGNRGKGKVSFSVSVSYALWQPGDTYRKLVERASDGLEEQKEALHLQRAKGGERKDQYAKDVRLVRKELMEQIHKAGAYCQDYETFKGIYRFLERGLIRSGQKACVILLTVVDEKGRSLMPHEKDVLMEQLGESIGETLRIGDIYTRYSSSQYLAIVIDTTGKMADLIVDRIRTKFLAEKCGNYILVHHCYELRPARITE